MKNPKETKLPVEERVDELVLDVDEMDAFIWLVDDRVDCAFDRIIDLEDHMDRCELHIDWAFDDANDALCVAYEAETKLNKNLPWLWIAVGLEAIVIVLQLFNII